MAQQWRSVLEQVAAGEVSVEEALARFHPESELGFAVIDDHRSLRTGLPEVIYTGDGETYLHLPGVIVAERASGDKRYLLGDGLGSIRQSVDEAGAVVF